MCAGFGSGPFVALGQSGCATVCDGESCLFVESSITHGLACRVRLSLRSLERSRLVVVVVGVVTWQAALGGVCSGAKIPSFGHPEGRGRTRQRWGFQRVQQGCGWLRESRRCVPGWCPLCCHGVGAWLPSKPLPWVAPGAWPTLASVGRDHSPVADGCFGCGCGWLLPVGCWWFPAALKRLARCGLRGVLLVCASGCLPQWATPGDSPLGGNPRPCRRGACRTPGLGSTPVADYDGRTRRTHPGHRNGDPPRRALWRGENSHTSDHAQADFA